MFFLAYSLALCSVAAIFYLKYWWKHRKFYELFDKIPLADGNYPLIGCSWRFLKTDPKSLYKALGSVTAKGPSPKRVFVGPACFIVVDDPDQIQKICNSRHCFDKMYFYKKLMLKTGELKEVNTREKTIKGQ
jgi:hypothetical protein